MTAGKPDRRAVPAPSANDRSLGTCEKHIISRRLTPINADKTLLSIGVYRRSSAAMILSQLLAAAAQPALPGRAGREARP